MRSEPFVVVVAVVVAVIALSAGCSDWPAAETLSVATTVQDRSGAHVVVDFDGAGRGEWWTCDLRLTSAACVGDHHVEVFLGLPVLDDVDELGSARCVDEQGPSGVFEIMGYVGTPLRIPDDVSAFVVLASDVDGDGLLDLDRDDELGGRATITAGEVRVYSYGAIDAPLTLRITGTTAAGDDVDVAFSGAMQAFGDPPPLESADSCG
ncbi:MAG TPA: hypothetical protein VGF99_05620 [Myxococcota bacterium]